MSSQRNKKTDEFNTRDQQRNPDKYMSGKNWLDHSKACAQIDQMLLTGADISKLLTSGRKLNAVKSHLNHLKSEHGLSIENRDGVYRFTYTDIPPGDSAPVTSERTPDEVASSSVKGDDTNSKHTNESGNNRAPAPTMESTQPIENGVLRHLLQDAENIIRKEAENNPIEDLQRQYEIISSRHFDTITDEPGILNNLIIQASSYSVVRKTFDALYPDEIWKFDAHYGTHFFQRDEQPQYAYSDWEEIVLTWGNVLLDEEGAAPVSDLTSLVSHMQQAHASNWASYSKQPRSRILLSLATALPKVHREILLEPVKFLQRLDHVSRNHPGHAYNLADQFAKDIIGMGNALVCNFFKELGVLYYVKVDVHVSDFMQDISLRRDLSNKEEFILSWLLAREADMEPFFLDKILYVGGKYCKPKLRTVFNAHRAAYEKEVNQLIDEIPALK